MLFTHVGRWPVGANPEDHQWKNYAVRNQRYRLVNGALFDLETDPGQTADVATAHPETVQAMTAAFDRFWKEARPLMVNETVPPSRVRPFWSAYRKQESTRGIPDWRLEAGASGGTLGRTFGVAAGGERN
jgi:arylsulfatase